MEHFVIIFMSPEFELQSPFELHVVYYSYLTFEVLFIEIISLKILNFGISCPS